MSLLDHSQSWTYGFCESCMKNANEKVKMVQENICGDSMRCFVCPQCGATKRL